MSLDQTYTAVARHFSQTRKKHWPEIDRIVQCVHTYCCIGAKIIDIGCGDGRLLAALDKQSQTLNMQWQLYGIDFAQGFVDLARSTIPHINIEHAEMLTYLSGQQSYSYDCVIFLASFHHLLSHTDQNRCLYHVKRILKPGGLLCMVNWSLSPWFTKKYIINIGQSLLQSILTLGLHDWRCISIPYHVAGVAYPRHYYLHTKSDLIRRCERYGFSLIASGDDLVGNKNTCLAFFS